MSEDNMTQISPWDVYVLLTITWNPQMITIKLSLNRASVYFLTGHWEHPLQCPKALSWHLAVVSLLMLGGQRVTDERMFDNSTPPPLLAYAHYAGDIKIVTQEQWDLVPHMFLPVLQHSLKFKKVIFEIEHKQHQSLLF